MNDLVSRQAAIDALSKAMPSLTTPDGSGQFDREIYVAQETFVDAMQIIHDMPSAEPERKTGHWIITEGEYMHSRKYQCSECGHQFKWLYNPDFPPVFNYCQKCGARMKE